MTPDDILFAVAPKNGKAPRTVIAQFDGKEFRDNLDTNSSSARKRFVKELAAKTGIDAAVLAQNVESRLVQLADSADLEAEQVARDFTPRPKPARLGRKVVLPGESATITETAGKLGALLGDTGRFYLRGGIPIRAVVVDGEVKLEPLRPAAACSDFDTVANLIRMKSANAGPPVEVSAVCSETSAKQILESQAFRSALPRITVLSRCPVLIERNGKLEVITGYDRASGIWAMGEVPEEMSLDTAREMLNTLLQDFHFASDGDRSRAKAAVITPALVFGGMLGGRAPIDAGEADFSQSGKGYRHKLTAATYRNQPRTITQRERGVGSMQETFDAALVSGACFPSFDNLRGKIESAGFESFMTEPVYFARIPYSWPMEIDATRTVVMLTTNKGEFTRDMTNRSSIVRIRKRADDYQYQAFPEGDLLDHVQANQSRYLGAVFAVVREWHRQGKPRLDNSTHDFKRWATTLGWIVENLLGAAPLVEGHRAVQERMSSPAGNWLRDLALAVRSAGKLGERLRSWQLLSIVVEAGVKTPGISEDLDQEDPATFNKAVRAIGTQMSRAIKGESVVVDDITVTRHEGQDAQSRTVKEYEFRQAKSDDGSLHQQSRPTDEPKGLTATFGNLGTPEPYPLPGTTICEKRGTPEPPQPLPTFSGRPPNTPLYKSVTEVPEVAGFLQKNDVSRCPVTLPEAPTQKLHFEEVPGLQQQEQQRQVCDPGQKTLVSRGNQKPNLTGVATLPISSEPIFVDLETRSACDLKKFGGRIYARHPTTGILSMVAIFGTEVIVWFPLLKAAPPANDMRPNGCPVELNVRTYVGAEFPPPLRDAISAGRPLCGHNAFDFDQPIWQTQGWSEPATWLDTIHMARAASMPGKLELLGLRLLGRGKDKEGERLLKLYRTPNKPGQFRPLNQEAATAIGKYNVQDVLICQEVYRRYHECVEPEVLKLDQKINSRGISFDTELAQGLIRLSADAARQTIQHVDQMTKGTLKGPDLRRDTIVLQWFRDHGLNLPNLQRETIENLPGRQNLPPVVRAVLQARMAAMRKSTSKLETGLLHVDDDGRLRHLLVYHQAHTGRWAGRGVQPQNLPRPHKKLGDVTGLIPAVDDLAMLQAKLPAGVSVDDAIAALVRPCFRAASGKLLITADFAAIEARGLAWCAGETELVAQFARGDDVYSQFATRLFGRPITKRDERERSIGKVAVLACGYSMGANRFGEKCRNDKVDLAAVGLTAERVIESYRDAYPAIAGRKTHGQYGDYRSGGLWKSLEIAARTAVTTGKSQAAARCSLERIGGDLVVRLPSGRRMFFREARVEMEVPSYATGNGSPASPKPVIYYTDTRNLKENLYGGKLAENIVSGICRDLQVAAMLGIEAAGLPIVLHVHDEIVVEVDEAAAEEALITVLRIMSTPPSWSDGFPVQAEGFVSARYVKSAPAGVISRSARNGCLMEP